MIDIIAAIFLAVALIVYMAVMARAAGGGLFGPKVWDPLPEMLFGAPFGVVVYLETGYWYFGVLAGVASYLFMEMGHGTFWLMDGYNKAANPTGARVQKVEKIVRPIYVGIFKGDIYKPLYSWLCFGVKGALIGAAAFPFGLALAVLWPFAYWIGVKVLKTTEKAEWISGAFAGLVIVASLLSIFY